MHPRADYCEIADCTRPVFRHGLCQTHVKRQQRGQDLSAPVAEAMTPKERVLEAGSAWLEAEEDDEYEAAERAFLRACEAWMRSKGWAPPARTAGPHRARRRARRVMTQLELHLPCPQQGRGST